MVTLLKPKDRVKRVYFIPGTGRFEHLLPPDENDRRYNGPEFRVQAPIIAPNNSENDRRYKGLELQPPIIAPNDSENNRRYKDLELQPPIIAPNDSDNDRRYDKGPALHSLIIAPNDSENDRRYEGPELQSPIYQEKNRVASITPPNYVLDRKANELPRQSDAVERVFLAPPPSYEAPRPPNDVFCYGKTLYIDPKARDSMPSLSVEYKLDSERPNKIHLRIQVRNRGYWVSELEFRIKFCNGAVILL